MGRFGSLSDIIYIVTMLAIILTGAAWISDRERGAAFLAVPYLGIFTATLARTMPQ